jgi:hypothetical protein
LVSELKNPATYLTLAAFIPTFWGIFFHSGGSRAPSVAYAVAHAFKASAHESRLKEIESAIVAGVVAARQAGISVAGLESDIASVLSSLGGKARKA